MILWIERERLSRKRISSIQIIPYFSEEKYCSSNPSGVFKLRIEMKNFFLEFLKCLCRLFDLVEYISFQWIALSKYHVIKIHFRLNRLDHLKTNISFPFHVLDEKICMIGDIHLLQSITRS